MALNRDQARHCKSRQTRRVMRGRKPHLISLPKVSSDDNPVETIFSDIQQMILDNSDDAGTRATQCCRSAHLRGRNRCDDRSIQITYLGNIHKHQWTNSHINYWMLCLRKRRCCATANHLILRRFNRLGTESRGLERGRAWYALQAV